MPQQWRLMGQHLGLSVADIDQAAADALTVAHAINGRSLYSSKSQEFTEYKNILLNAPINTPLPTTPTPPVVGVLGAEAMAACIPRARQRSERIKAHPNYTPAIGEDCRIIAPETSEATGDPVLKAVAETSYAVRLTFALKRHRMIEIQCVGGTR